MKESTMMNMMIITISIERLKRMQWIVMIRFNKFLIIQTGDSLEIINSPRNQ